MTTPRTQPPFRADHVGSLLRPKPLQQARARWKAGTMTHEALREVEDSCITEAIARQEAMVITKHGRRTTFSQSAALSPMRLHTNHMRPAPARTEPPAAAHNTELAGICSRRST